MVQGISERYAAKLRKKIMKDHGGAFCSKGGPHRAPSRSDKAKCLKCGKTMAELRKEFESVARKMVPKSLGGEAE